MTSNYQRGKSYRSDFFKCHPGIFHKYYVCSYCGRMLTKKTTTVDHLIPVCKVKRMGIGRILLWLNGIYNVNDTRNLVAACQRCNSRKSDKMGAWVIKGTFGRHLLFWLLRDALIIGLLIYTYITFQPQIHTFFASLLDNISFVINTVL